MAMHDYVASFYGGYDQLPLRRVARLRIRATTLAVGLAAITLVALVAADVSTYESFQPVVHVSAVSWYGEGILLGSGPGFSVRAGEAYTLPTVCSSICFPWISANVSAPFSVASFSVVYAGLQYANVTLRAPESAYSGPLNVYLYWA